MDLRTALDITNYAAYIFIVLLGLLCTLLGHRIIGARPGVSKPADTFHRQYGRIYRVLGPILISAGLLLLGLRLWK